MRNKTKVMLNLVMVFSMLFSLTGPVFAAPAVQTDGPERLGPTLEDAETLAPTADVIQDGGFEDGTPNAYWNEYSYNFGTPICDLGSCGSGTGTGPRSGDYWTWFGGISAYEEGSVTQDVFIPSGTATLSFWLEMIICDSADDYMEVLIDGDQVFYVDGSSGDCGILGYHQETVDVSAYADGDTHTIEFYSEIFASNGGGTNFFLDDVVLDAEPSGGGGGGEVTGCVEFCEEETTTFILLEEDFEGSFPPTGWTNPATASTFVQTSLRAHGGTYSAYHNDNIGFTEAWLISPQISLNDNSWVSFWQSDNWNSYYYLHQVWLSTGSGDPTDGDFTVKLYEGNGPEDAWQQIELDLSDYAGQDVYIGWYYEGDFADEWYLDDIQVGYDVVETTCYLELCPETQTGQACLGETTSHEYRITNLGDGAATFDLALTDYTWASTLSDASLALNPGESAMVTLDVEIPFYNFVGDYDMASFEVSQSDYVTATLEGFATTVAGEGWVTAPAGGNSVVYPAFTTDGEKLYYFDGLDATGAATKAVQIFDPLTGWLITDTLIAGPNFGGVAGYDSANDTIYRAIGFDDSWMASAGFGYIDLTNMTGGVLAPMPEALGLGAGGVTDSGKFVWAGGSPNLGFLPDTPVWVYDIATNIWSAGTTLTGVGFTAPGYVMVGDELYVGGNYFGDPYFYVYDVSADTWTQLADLPGGAVAPLLIFDGTDIYAVGGGYNPVTPYASTWRYDMVADMWSEFAPLSMPVLGSGGGYLMGALYTFGGGMDGMAYEEALHEKTIAACPPQTTGELTGTVINGVTGLPIEGVLIEAVGTGAIPPPLGVNATTPYAYTDANGEYLLMLAAGALYDLTASFGDYDGKSATDVPVTVAGPNVQDFVMGPPVADPSATNFSVTLEWAMTATVTMTLDNPGYSDLDFEFTEENGGAPAVAQNGPAVVEGEAPLNGIRVTEDEISMSEALSLVATTDRLPQTVAPTAPNAILWEQGIGGTGGIVSDFALDNNLGTYSADDFVIADPSWDIATLYTPGFVNSDDLGNVAYDLNWYIYADAAGKPAGAPGDGLEVWSYTAAVSDPEVSIVDDAVSLDVDALGGLNLPTGTYWLIFYPTVDSISDANMRWNWYQGATSNGYLAMLFDEGNFGGALPWTPINDLVGSGYDDLAFRIDGEIGSGGGGGGDIPWLSEDPITGTIPYDMYGDVNLIFDANVPALGTYTGTLMLNSNDPANPVIEMPVELIVVENPDASKIEGTVTSDRPGGPLDGATVYLEGESGFVELLNTDELGFYELMILPEDVGEYTVTVSYPGYIPDQQVIQLPAGATVTHDVELVFYGPDMSVDPNEIEVTLEWGNAITESFTIENNGVADLEYFLVNYGDLGGIAYFEDFELDNGGYTVVEIDPTATWEWGMVETDPPGGAASGSYAWGTNLSGNYDANEFSFIYSPAIDLSAYPGSDIWIDVAQFVNTVVNNGTMQWDVAWVMFSVNGGANWFRPAGFLGNWGDDWWNTGPIYIGSAGGITDFHVGFMLETDYFGVGANLVDLGYYVDDVVVLAGPPWKHESQYEGTIAPLGSNVIGVHLDSDYVPAPGTYEADIVVSGDDLFNPEEVVHVTMNVIDNPDQALVFGQVLGNRTDIGEDLPLEGALVSLFGPEDLMTYTDANGYYEIYIPPWATDALYTVVTTYPGYHPDITQLYLAAGSFNEHNVTLRLFESWLQVDPETIYEMLPWGGYTEIAMTVTNPVESGDTLEAHILEVAASYTPPIITTVEVEAAAIEADELVVEGEYYLDSVAHDVRARTLEAEINALSLSPLQVGIFSFDYEVVGYAGVALLADMINAYPDMQATVLANDYMTVDELLNYQVIIVTGRYNTSLDNDLLGDMFAEYIDAGGRVIMAQNTFLADGGGALEWYLGGRFQAEYAPVTYGTVRYVGTEELAVFDPAHPIMAGWDPMYHYVTDYFRSFSDLTLANGGEPVAYWDTGNYYIVANQYVAVFNQVLTLDPDFEGHVPMLLHNTVLFLANQDIPWLDASVKDFVLPVGNSANTTVSLDAGAVDQPGTYNAWLWFDNNDPLQPGAYVPVTLVVEADPNMARLEGTITLNRSAMGDHVPAPLAAITIDSAVGMENMLADANGQYVYYFEAADLPLDVTVGASYPEYADGEAMATLTAGTTTVLDIELLSMAPWITASPTHLEVLLIKGYTETLTFDIENLGLSTLNIPLIQEITYTLPMNAQASALGGTYLVEGGFTVDADVSRALTTEGEADFFIWLRERADLTPAYNMTDLDARRTWVYETLTGVAEASQAGILRYLDERGLDYTSYWINNSILVKGADQAVVDYMADSGLVTRIRGVYTRQYIPNPETLQIVTFDPGVEADPTWNIDIVNAPLVWDQLGITGAGVVVSNIDTGVEYTHDALVDGYRGNLGGNTFDHDYNWFAPSQDARDQCETYPCDYNGHGTHTMGTIAGGDGDGPFALDIGMAPDAEWIACMGCDGYGPGGSGGCSEEALTTCAQWIVAPTDVYGDNPDPLMAPDVVNNSWGGGSADDWYYSYAAAWNAANIIPVFSAGNAGPNCNTLGSPGDMGNVIGVGGTDSNDFNYASSSRGPGAGTGVFPVQKPNIAAPGEAVPSSVPGNGYASYSGTSMAAPHVAGITALLRQVDPDITMDEILMALTSTAVTDLDIKNGTWCGAGPDFPNYVFGYGRIDALSAVTYLMSSDLPWVEVEPTVGMIDPLPAVMNYDGTMTVEVTFDSNPVEPGVYEGALRVLHNDPFTGEVIITLRLTVLPRPTLFLPYIVQGYPVLSP